MALPSDKSPLKGARSGSRDAFNIVLHCIKILHHTDKKCNIYQTVKVSACEGIDKYAYT